MYYHFLKKDECLRYPPYTKVEVGQTLTCEGKLELCQNGLHASRRVLDALRYAPGPILCEVKLRGKKIYETDKVCARSRKVISMRNITPVLHEFACRIAEGLLVDREIISGPCWDAIAIKRKWMKGEASDKELFKATDVAASSPESYIISMVWGTGWRAAKSAAMVSSSGSATRRADLNDLLMELLCTTTS